MVIVFILCTGCKAYPAVESYRDLKGKHLEIEGVEYTRNNGDWGLDHDQLGAKIGYLDEKPIYEMKGDTNRNYIYVEDGPYHESYFRTDFAYPEISADTVNKIVWYGPERKVATIEEADTISQVFDELYNNEPTSADNISEFYGVMYCRFNSMLGLEYFIWVRIQDGEKIIGNNKNEHYFKISDDLLEKLSGNDE